MRKVMRGQRWLVSVATFLCALVPAFALSSPAEAASASSVEANGPRTWHVSVGVESKDHGIQGMGFFPGEIWINQGDTMQWTSHAGEIHTVTFLATGQTRPPFNPGDPSQAGPVGGSHYDGHSYFNSGLLIGVPGAGLPTQYSLTFDVTGDYTFLCLVHSMMSGTVHVRAAGTEYPFSQRHYDELARKAGNHLLADGRHEMAEAREVSTNHLVTVGIGDGMVMVARFFPDSIQVDVGDTVTFINRDVETPHTVTFGPDPQNEFVPYGGSVFSGQPVSSGLIGAPPFGQTNTYTLKFAKAGTFQFRCLLHDNLSMFLTVVVE